MSEPSKLPSAIDLGHKLDLFDKQWTPHRIATFDQHQLVLAKVQGEFVWHDHADHDEVFLPVNGTLWIDFEGGESVELGPGQVLVVPAGVAHRPRTRPEEEVQLLIIDPLTVQHTGAMDSDRTVQDYPTI
ncbi:MAG: cupin domain-containing protein [Planctomycetota bacterium]|nr:cupin domain-containing protein [Planctomycetota bacterium]